MQDAKTETVGGLDQEQDSVENNITLQAQDKKEFVVSRDVALMSALVQTMMEGDEDEKQIPLPNVGSDTLALIVEWMKHHVKNPAKEIEKPLRSALLADIVSDVFDVELVDKLSQDKLFALILAANYMDIAALLDLGCAKVASLIKGSDSCLLMAKWMYVVTGKTPEQIRKTFNIINDFTPEEEEAVRAENKWAEDT